nr:hypothetical protein OG999_16895 [Streptomyces sp. NBC_00886]
MSPLGSGDGRFPGAHPVPGVVERAEASPPTVPVFNSGGTTPALHIGVVPPP